MNPLHADEINWTLKPAPASPNVFRAALSAARVIEDADLADLVHRLLQALLSERTEQRATREALYGALATLHAHHVRDVRRRELLAADAKRRSS